MIESKKRLLVIVISALLIIGLVTIAYAQPMFRGQRAMAMKAGSAILENPKVKEKLKLTDEQINKIKEVNQDVQKKLIDLRAKMEIAQIDLQSLLDASSIDKSAIENKIEELGKIRTEIQKTEVNRRIAMKEILTPEQQQKIKDFIGKKFAQRAKEEQKGKGFLGFMKGERFKQGQEGRGNQGFMGGEGFRQGQPGMQGCPMWNQGQCPGFPGMAPAPIEKGKHKNKGEKSGAFKDNPGPNKISEEIGTSAQNPEEIAESEDISQEDSDDISFLFN